MKIVCVSACTVGIAHTFMAEAALKKEAEKRKYSILVETQGSMGVENKLEDEDIQNADVVILAIDAKITGSDRFVGKKVIEVSTSDVIHNVASVFDKAEKLMQ